jgi:hypothetical protein
MLGMQDYGLSITLQQFKMKVQKLTNLNYTKPLSRQNSCKSLVVLGQVLTSRVKHSTCGRIRGLQGIRFNKLVM